MARPVTLGTHARSNASLRALLMAAMVSFFAASVLAAQPALPAGALVGTVLSDSGDVPIANAEIAFPNLTISARSDGKGNFQITGVPTGSHELIVRSVGYEPYVATITFRVAQKIEADFMMKPLVTKLPKVKVKAVADARYAIRLADFEERRQFGAGRFLTSDVFDKATGQNMSQVLMRSIPGIRTIGKGTQQTLVSTPTGFKMICKVQVIVNGLIRYNGRVGDSDFDINSVYSGDVIGLEYYTLTNTPAQFMGTGASVCGSIVIWTK